MKQQKFHRLHFLIAKALEQPDLLMHISTKILKNEVGRNILKGMKTIRMGRIGGEQQKKKED